MYLLHTRTCWKVKYVRRVRGGLFPEPDGSSFETPFHQRSGLYLGWRVKHPPSGVARIFRKGIFTLLSSSSPKDSSKFPCPSQNSSRIACK
ncbi:hypothetical protein AVEN_131386-1 [Araneus ventricosus]|uniref:Uncharacterized protein n=1 Tax=Araneus ventricosus TaxID=182803 RepID=A0A4Y2U2D1_ARAVE|nr:hypothetical protein AVEN_131386-1 [Araneus ventricosus]